MSWTKQTKTVPGAAVGWGDQTWGTSAWGGTSGTSWINQSKASDSWTSVSSVSDSWTKQTKAE